MGIDVDRLKSQVQKNCDISDASYGGCVSLCSLFFRLRDLYKWAHNLFPWQEPEPAVLLEWVDAREKLWEQLAARSFEPISIDSAAFDPFDMAAINALLRPQGLVYGAGYVSGMKPSFFLGKVCESRVIGEIRIDIIDEELARDLFTTPAMRQGNQVFARRSAMLFTLWDQIFEMRPSGKEALAYGLRQYGLDPNALRKRPPDLAQELKRVAGRELEAWIHHEIGEVREDAFEGHQWHEIIASYPNSPIELYARVIKDLLADTHPDGLLGHIVRNELSSSLGFYVSFLRPFTRLMFPEILEAFAQFRADEEWLGIERARGRGYAKAADLARTLVSLHDAGRERGHEWAVERITSQLIDPLGILTTSNENKDEVS